MSKGAAEANAALKTQGGTKPRPGLRFESMDSHQKVYARSKMVSLYAPWNSSQGKISSCLDNNTDLTSNSHQLWRSIMSLGVIIRHAHKTKLADNSS